ncbi:MAG: alpha/beta hydrolase [Pirellulaceae bacterium]
MWRHFRRLVLAGGLTALGVVALLAMLEASLMYPAPPVARGDWSPDWLQHEEVFIETSFDTIHGWLCPHPNAKRHILVFHGNGEHVASMAEELDFLREHLEATVFAFDYRGYGKSGGKPFEAGILQDGMAAQAWLAERSNIPKSSIVLWGRSLGGAVAIHCASQTGSETLVLDRTFNSMVDVASHHYPWLPVRTLLSNRYPSDKRIGGFHGGLFQVHGAADEVVPFHLAVKLFDACPSESKVFVESPTMTHNDPWSDDQFRQVKEFIQASEERQTPGLGPCDPT